MKKWKMAISFAVFICGSGMQGQPISETPEPAGPARKPNQALIYYFGEDQTRFVKLSFLNQMWLRHTENNPGSTVFDTPQNETYDIGLRRTRIQLFGQLTEKVFFYTQIGQNNLSHISSRKQGLFFLDATADYKVAGNYLSIGSGLTGWSGLSRYASPSVGSIMTMDAPIYQQSTIDITDQFLRKLSIYAKGKVGKLDYRLALSDPMSVQNSVAQTGEIGTYAQFATEPGKAQFQGYLMYQFLESESNQTAYNVGTYLGAKSVFNIGAGFITQRDAMWHLSAGGADTLRSALRLFAVDVYYDAPLNREKGTALTAYASFSSNDYGQNYVRNVGVMNPETGTDAAGSVNGPGNAFPMMGTGEVVYGQLGYLLHKDLLGKAGTLQPYIAGQGAYFDLLADPMYMYEGGVNWLIEGHRAKVSLNYQSRPVFMANPSGEINFATRRSMVVLQFQIAV